MNNVKLFSPDHVLFDDVITTKEDCLKKLAAMATDVGIGTSEEEILDGFFLREKECTTGFGGGFAIPHTKCAAVKQPGILFFHSSVGMEWQSFDDKPVFVAIALLVPDEAGGNLHLSLLSSLSRKLMNKEFKERLQNADNKELIYEIIMNAIKED